MVPPPDPERHEKLLLLGTQTAHLVHDWNNTLTLLQAHCAELPDSETSRALLESLHAAADLPKQLLSYLRATPPSRQRIALDDWLRSLEPALRQLAGRRIRFFPDLSAPAAKIEVDPAQLRNALFNLILNAKAALGEHGRLRLITSQSPTEIIITLEDNGHGIDEATQQHLFDPFFSTGPDSHRTGLGLSGIKTFMDSHQGRIEVASAPGTGAKFTLVFPV